MPRAQRRPGRGRGMSRQQQVVGGGSGKCPAAHGGGSQLSLRPGAQAPLTSSACPVRAGAVPLGEHHMFARALGPPAMRIWLLQSLVGLQVGSGPPPCSLARGGGGDGLL